MTGNSLPPKHQTELVEDSATAPVIIGYSFGRLRPARRVQNKWRTGGHRVEKV
jgi:hypothetical protein